MDDQISNLTEKANAAFRAMTRTVIETARRTGTPIIVGEDGRIKELPSTQLEQATTQRTAEESGF
jgi:hypothetical protein